MRKEPLRREGARPDTSQLVWEAARDKLGHQLGLVSSMDTKASIIAGLDAGILALGGPADSGGVPRLLLVLGFALLVAGLIASLFVVYVRRMHVIPSMRKLWTEHVANPGGQALVELAARAAEAVEHNASIIMSKRARANVAIVLSLAGFCLVGSAHIATLLLR